MAFPVIADAPETSQSTNVTSHPMTMPSGITAGELLVVVFANDGSATVTWPGDWNSLFTVASGTAARLSAAYKFAAGSDTLSVTTSAGENSAGFVMRITGAHASTIPEAGSATNNTTTTPNPPILNPANWDIEDTLWLAVIGVDGAGTISGTPASYNVVGDGYARGSGTAANSAWCGLYQRNNAVASEDPASFTIVSEDWCANTIGIRPAAVPVPPIVSVMAPMAAP